MNQRGQNYCLSKKKNEKKKQFSRDKIILTIIFDSFLAVATFTLF